MTRTSTELARLAKAEEAVVGTGGVVRIGFVPLIDAAPLIAAHELGLFEKHGVRVRLERQVGWANVRDKLTYGHLDAGHALLGIPLTSALGIETPREPLVSVMELGSGGNAVTLSKNLVARGIRSAAALARWTHERPRFGGADDHRPVLAHVFGCSTHHYLLREWLSAGGVDPDLDVRLCAVPPQQMPDRLRDGHLDGFCAGDPYNTLAERDGYGSVVTATTDILPDHPEKVLAVTKRWAAANGPAVVAVIRATLEACRWCDDEANHPALATMLSADRYIGLAADHLAASLRVDRSIGVTGSRPTPASGRPSGPPRQADRFVAEHSPADWRPVGWRMRSFAVARTFPAATHAVWLAEQMIRWGHAPGDVDLLAVARRCTDARHYRKAAADLGIAVPTDDFGTMPLRHGGCYDPRRTAYRGGRRSPGTPAGPMHQGEPIVEVEVSPVRRAPVPTG